MPAAAPPNVSVPTELMVCSPPLAEASVPLPVARLTTSPPTGLTTVRFAAAIVVVPSYGLLPVSETARAATVLEAVAMVWAVAPPPETEMLPEYGEPETPAVAARRTYTVVLASVALA